MDRFEDRLDGGWKWWEAAIEEAQEGRWVRDAVEGQVIKDIAAGQAAPLLQPIDASLDRVALPIRLGVESRWATTSAASPQTVADLVGRLGNDSADSASTEVISDRAG